ncbi:MAG: tetratricopeptide repeat protein [Spirochaetaceae bacterium]
MGESRVGVPGSDEPGGVAAPAPEEPSRARQQSAPAPESRDEGGSRRPAAAQIDEEYPYQLTESSEERRSSVGEQLLVTLDGEGWLYLGVADGSRGVRFLSQREEGGQTSFRFRLTDPGSYELRFQRQDLFAAEVEEHAVLLDARGEVSPGEGRDSLTEASGSPDPQQEGELGAGGSLSALGEGAELTEEDESGGNRQRSPASEAELLEDLDGTIRRLIDDPDSSVLAFAESLRAEGRRAGALSLLEAYSRSGERESSLDEILYAMATLLEEPGETRDLRRAHSLYRRLVDEHPLSRYYGDSRQRAEYLERHFFLIR